MARSIFVVAGYQGYHTFGPSQKIYYIIIDFRETRSDPVPNVSLLPRAGPTAQHQFGSRGTRT